MQDWLTGTPAVVALTTGALALVVWSAAGIYARYQRLERLAAAPAADAPSVKGTDTPRFRAEDIVSAHLFGRPAPKAVAVTEAPETRLQLKLLGVVASDGGPDIARAIIQVENDKARPYRIGELVDNTEARLHAVESKRVLLDRNGTIESLPLAMKSVSPQAPGAGGGQPAPPRPQP